MQLWRLIFGDAGLGEPVHGVYDPVMVALSVGVACLGGFGAFAVADRIRAAPTASFRRRWLAAGACAMGGGIWAMHFTGMLAFSMHGGVTYDLPLTVLSIVPGLIGSAVALSTMARPFAGWGLQQSRALAMAAGIGAMHYTGMEAMRMHAQLYYDGWLFILSIVVAHALATVALYLKEWDALRRAAPLMLGFAVAGMHYTAMAATRFYVLSDAAPAHGELELPPLAMAAGIVSIVAVITGCALVAVRIDKWLQATAAALHDTEVRERSLLESMVEGVLSVDSRAVVESANTAAKRMFLLDGERIEGVSLDQLLPKALPAASEAGSNGAAWQAIQGQETMGRRKDGGEFPAEFTTVAYESGGQRYCSVIIRDVSRRKQQEQQLRQSQKLESIGQLAAGIAHEINTPTQYLSDNIRFLQDSFGQLSGLVKLQQGLLEQARSEALTPEAEQEYEEACEEADLDFLMEETPRSIEESLEGLERIASIVRSLKEFSHPDSEEMTSADLNRAITSTITVARNEWKYVAEVETDFDPNLPPVKCHLGDVNQVFLNLIVNAAQAIGGAGDSLGRQGVIRVRTKQDGDWVEVRIEDNGPGIPAEIRDRIFDPFFTTKEVGSGTGQGLAIAHGIIGTKHGGTIRVESEPGEGAAFIVRLPLAGVAVPA